LQFSSDNFLPFHTTDVVLIRSAFYALVTLTLGNLFDADFAAFFLSLFGFYEFLWLFRILLVPYLLKLYFVIEFTPYLLELSSLLL